jgi:hypothetical protein
LCEAAGDAIRWERPAYFHARPDKHLDLVARRLLREETLPAPETVFSLFEPHPGWIQKGQQRPNVELGHRLLLAPDQHPLIPDSDVPVGEGDLAQSVPVADRWLGRYGMGGVVSLSCDKIFTRTEDRERLSCRDLNCKFAFVALVTRQKMHKRSLPGIWCACLALVCGWFSTTSRGELKTFKLDTNQSVLTISGTFAGADIQPQGTGSLTTKYQGTIRAEVTSSTITFVGGSSVVALNNGSWQPLTGGGSGSAPANYGAKVSAGFVSAIAAVRNLLLDVTSGELAVTGGTFPSQELQYVFPSNGTAVLDYRYTLIVIPSSGSQPLTNAPSNTASTNATLAVQGAELVLTVPVDISVTGTVINTNDLKYRIRGKVQARAPVTIPLKIAAFQVSAGQLAFTIATTPGKSYTILGSSDLINWPTTVDQFTATTNPTVRNVAWPAPPPRQYFQVRQVSP